MKVIIGGAGITGLAVGCYLQQKGIDFQIFENRDQAPVKWISIDNQKSTGIQLASNCHFVFRELGIYDQIKEASMERKNLKVHSERNYLNNLSVTNDHDEGTFFIRRGELISILSSLIPTQKISWSTSIVQTVDEKSKVNLRTLKIKGNYQEVSSEHTADLFIDCTGANSQIAKNSDNTNSTAIWGISDYSDEMFKSFNNFMYTGMHFVTYPLTKDKTAFTLVMDNSRLSEQYLDRLMRIVFNTANKEPKRLLNKLLKDKFKDLINSSRDCVIGEIGGSNFNKWGSGNIIFLGDSAHAITPHLAQGAAQGLIDAAYLNRGFSTNLDPEEFFAKRNSIINKIRSEAKLNKDRYQLGMPFKLLRNIYLKLYKPNYGWLFNSKYEA